MDQDLLLPRLYADTFGGMQCCYPADYCTIDYDVNPGYRTPFQDADAKQADAIFEKIIAMRQQKRQASLHQSHP